MRQAPPQHSTLVHALQGSGFATLICSLVLLVSWLLPKIGHRHPAAAPGVIVPIALFLALLASLILAASRWLRLYEQRSAVVLNDEQQIERLYLKLVRAQIEAAQHHPLHYTAEEIIDLQAEMVERTFECHLSADATRGLREKKWTTKNLVRELDKATLPIVVLAGC